MRSGDTRNCDVLFRHSIGGSCSQIYHRILQTCVKPVSPSSKWQFLMTIDRASSEIRRRKKKRKTETSAEKYNGRSASIVTVDGVHHNNPFKNKLSAANIGD